MASRGAQERRSLYREVFYVVMETEEQQHHCNAGERV